MNANYQTLKEAGYTYYKQACAHSHILKNSDGGFELFVTCKNFSGWAIKYKNTHLEFACSIDENDPILILE